MPGHQRGAMPTRLNYDFVFNLACYSCRRASMGRWGSFSLLVLRDIYQKPNPTPTLVFDRDQPQIIFDAFANLLRLDTPLSNDFDNCQLPCGNDMIHSFLDRSVGARFWNRRNSCRYRIQIDVSRDRYQGLFGRSMAGDAIDHATTSFLEEMVDFFPRSRRALLTKALGKLRQQLCIGCNSVSKSKQVPLQVQFQHRSPNLVPSYLSNGGQYLHWILEQSTAKNRFDWTAYRSKRERQPKQNRDSTI